MKRFPGTLARDIEMCAVPSRLNLPSATVFALQDYFLENTRTEELDKLMPRSVNTLGVFGSASRYIDSGISPA